MSDRTPAITFPAGPLSPPSPAAGSSAPKESQHLPPFLNHTPQTPTSPPLMSVSDSNNGSNFTSTQAPSNQATVHHHSSHGSSPYSSTPVSTQASQPPALNTKNSFSTPASSVSGHLTHATSFEEPDLKALQPGTQAATSTMNPGSEPQTADYMRTDHDRQSIFPPSIAGGLCDGAADEKPDPDAMDVDKEPVSRSGTHDLGLDSLQKDFQSAYHLCKSSPIPTGPDPSWDLISLYGLGSIAQSVARIHPVTGEKINRLRKSYEGKLKPLGLAGKNKPIKTDSSKEGSLRYLTLWPEEEWQNQKVFGKQIKTADMDSALLSLQTKAMQLQPGMAPNNDFWEDVLGLEKPVKVSGPGDMGKKGTPTPGGRLGAQPMVASGAGATDLGDRARPSRGRKRNYDDNSFVGYGEGYADDDDETGFYSNGEGAGKKKRKKDHVSKVSTPMSERSGSYGVGMFGIGAR
ncbi:Uncharacterized protein PECH_004226 [Penicillium ucsense]|uniref:Mediator of RNA polymerase II transcription subunit 19 n=1 Tax=Penicillium ucsense TaxID=2839758 RepID=A0A8J8WCT5_9EURO|nr:Uncharacterized protein PECM_003779 [Penicillium ucsense]KAF7726948.1 Uncharacterized protein PECH_004226 [Penicillium ucsense]